MIKGIDIGNFATKDNLGYSFESKVSFIPNSLGNKYTLELNGERFFLGEGEFDTEYRKVKKKSYLKLLYGILCLSSSQEENEIDLVLGLPLGQYKYDYQKLELLVRDNCYLDGYFNTKRRVFIIRNCEIYLEGLAAVQNDYQGIVVDIGGKTTDACYVHIKDGVRKVENALSLPTGTLNLYSDLINLINANHGLDLRLKDTENLIKNGLLIDGLNVDISKEMIIFKEYLDNLISNLNIQYSLRTNKVAFTGGGSLLLRKSIMRRVNHAIISSSANFDIARGFYKKGVELWG